MRKFSSNIISIANLAGDWHVWAFYLNMLMELSSCKVLKFFSIANIATKFWAMELSMYLKFSKSFPNDFRLSVLVASVGEFTKINTVL